MFSYWNGKLLSLAWSCLLFLVLGLCVQALVFGPGPVCSPKCPGDAKAGNVTQFMADRCCTFIPCPKNNTHPEEYKQFHDKHCPKTMVPPTHVGTGGNSVPKFVGGHGPVCKPECPGLAKPGNETQFKSNGCCTFIPCPKNNTHPEEYQQFHAKNCPKTVSTGTNTNGTRNDWRSVPPIFIGGPGPVCNPRCPGYAAAGNATLFRADKCCTFWACPQNNTNQKQYNEFHAKNCPNKKLPPTSPQKVTGSQPSGPHGHIPIHIPLTPLGPSEPVCKPECPGYAKPGYEAQFKGAKCCTFIPCPKNNTRPEEYQQFYDKNCPKTTAMQGDTDDDSDDICMSSIAKEESSV